MIFKLVFKWRRSATLERRRRKKSILIPKIYFPPYLKKKKKRKEQMCVFIWISREREQGNDHRVETPRMRI